MEVLLTDETDAAKYVIERVGMNNIHYWGKQLYIKTTDKVWITHKKQIHQYLLNMYSLQMTMWVERVNRFNQLYHMLTVLCYRIEPPKFT